MHVALQNACFEEKGMMSIIVELHVGMYVIPIDCLRYKWRSMAIP